MACVSGRELGAQRERDCNVVAGKYQYLMDLLALDQCRPALSRAVETEPGVSSPVCWEAWKKALVGHPDQAFVTYLLEGLKVGFRIGFDYCKSECRASRRNMLSARKNPTVVEQYLQEERSLGRLVGLQAGHEGAHISPFGVIPKPHQPGKWRLILDLSSPRGAGVNDGIDRQLCSLRYAGIGDAARRVVQMGKGTLLAKMDLQSAYRIVPVHPDDRHLLGMRWNGSVCLDTALPFGLRSAPKLFSAVADALLWVMFSRGVTTGLHYLDDFLFFGQQGTLECLTNLSRALETCRGLGVPVAQQKIEGPSAVMVYLGIEIDTIRGCLRLPEEKLARLQSLLQEWSTKKGCTKRELLSLIGSLQHAATVIKPGRVFLRRLIDLSTVPKQLHYYVRLNQEARSDICWWAKFIEHWNGYGLLAAVGGLLPSVAIQSDASGSWGCGAVLGRSWIQLEWPSSWSSRPIAPKEMAPIILSALAFGRQLQHHYVVFESDNSTVVSAIRNGSCREPHVMQLLRMLHFVAAHYAFTFTSTHRPGSCNGLADAVSRNFSTNESSVFRAQLDSVPTPVSAATSELVCNPQIDWMSDNWNRQFRASLAQV